MASRPQKKKAPAAEPQPSWFSNWRFWLPRAALIVGLTFLIFWPCLTGGWIWDDVWYLPENPLMQNVGGLWKFWFRARDVGGVLPDSGDRPVAAMAFLGLQTRSVIISPMFFYTSSTPCSSGRLLAKFGLRFAWIGGLIFAIHPAQVESVA